MLRVAARPCPARTLALALALSSAGASAPIAAGCKSVGSSLVTLMPGVLNDPGNRTLRRELLGFGSKEFCKEALRRGAPLKLRDDSPSVGRFFADACDYRELEGGDVVVQIAGRGYVWSQPTAKLTFRASATVLYNPDFLVHEGSIYAYFRTRSVQASQFKSEVVQLQQQSALGGLLGGASQDVANRIGSQIVAQELTRGFTVLRHDNGEVEFGVGTVELGARPAHPYDVRHSSKVSLASDTVEIHQEQREFLGPFAIDDDDRALTLTANVDGVPAVDVMIVRKDMGDFWLGQYLKTPPATGLPGPPVVGDVARAGHTWQRTVALPRGVYYLVVDNTSVAGPSAPPAAPQGALGTGDSAAVVRYLVQLGEAP